MPYEPLLYQAFQVVDPDLSDRCGPSVSLQGTRQLSVLGMSEQTACLSVAFRFLGRRLGECPLSSKREVVEESETYRRYVGRDHAHDWTFAQGSPYYFFGTTWSGCAIGAGRHRNQFAECFEEFERFGVFIWQKEDADELGADETLGLLLLPHYLPEDSPAQIRFQKQSEKADNLIDEFWKQL